MEYCGSCKKSVMNDRGSVSFQCPKCGKDKIVRCTSCRKNAVRYFCSQCENSGPN